MLISFILFFSIWTHGDIEAQGLINIPKKIVNEKLQESPLEVDLKELPFENSFSDKITAKDARYSMKLKAYPQLLFKNQVYTYLEIDEIALSLFNFKYQDIITIKRKGVNARVHVNVQCEEFNLYLQDWTGVLDSQVSYEESKGFKIDVKDFYLASAKMEMDFSNCVTPKGIEGLFKEELLKLLTDRESTLELAKYVTATVQEKINQVVSVYTKQFNFLDLVELKFNQVEFTDQSLRVLPLIKLKSEEAIKLPQVKKDQINENTLGAYFPKDLLYKAGPALVNSFLKTLKKSDIPSAAELLKNRFILFFVWSDLLNFKSSIDFNFVNEFLFSKMGFTAKTQEKILMSFDSSLNSTMNFVGRDLKNYSYMDFTGRASGEVEFNINKNSIHLSMSHMNLNLKSDWNPNMYSWRKSKASGKPWMSVILGQVEKSLNKLSYTYSWKDTLFSEYIKDVKVNLEDTELIQIQFFVKETTPIISSPEIN